MPSLMTGKKIKMKLIEFVDKEALEHIAAAISLSEDEIIFIGSRSALKDAENLERVIKDRNFDTRITLMPIPVNNLRQIVQTLDGIVSKGDEFCFDLTGGDDLALVAVGIIYERYKDKSDIRLYRINLKSEYMVDCVTGETISVKSEPQLTADEVVSLHGGAIRYHDSCENGSYNWDFSPEFIADIKSIWNICSREPHFWNIQISAFSKLMAEYADNLYLSYSVFEATEVCRENRFKYFFSRKFLKELEEKGIIKNLKIDEKISFSFKNEQVKRCLSKAGNALELFVTVSALEIRYDPDPELSFFDDVINGALIDWDSEFHNINDSVKDTQNEIDIILTYGYIPIFISCKNGKVDEEELYKLSTVAEYFGGSHAVRVLISSNNCDPYLKQRAQDMNIKLIENFKISGRNPKEVEKILKGLIK